MSNYTIPTKYTPSCVLDKRTKAYHELKKDAMDTNLAKMGARPQDRHKWSKSQLTEEEKFYLWNSQKGKCARMECRRPLDKRTMTIEHVEPKSKREDLMWDIHNMTILCCNCNSKKRDNMASDLHTPWHYAPMSMVYTDVKKHVGHKSI